MHVHVIMLQYSDLPIVPHESSTVMFSLMDKLPFNITKKRKYARDPNKKCGNETIVLSGAVFVRESDTFPCVRSVVYSIVHIPSVYSVTDLH